MANAEIKEKLLVSKEHLFKSITDYENYPSFVDGCTSVVVKRTSDKTATVTYNINMMKEISYTLNHTEDLEKGEITWELVSSDFLKKNSGRWELKASGANQVDVFYEIEIDFKFPVPGLILNRLVKGSLPSMIKGFEKHAKKLAKV